MKDFGKLSKLQWKKNALWIILLILGTLLINTINFRYNVNSTYSAITNSVTDFQYYLGMKEDKKKEKPEKITLEYIKYGNKLRDKVVKKYDIIPNKKLLSMDSKKVDKYYEKNRNDIFYQVDSSINSYDYNIESIMHDNPENSFLSTYTNSFMIPFLFVLAMLFTSIEHMTNYFDFSRMLPWSKTKDFIMKTVFGVLIVIVSFGIHIGIEQVIVMTSGLSEIYNTTGLLLYFIKVLILYSLIFIIFMSAGGVSGNIFGHLGINIIIFGFLNIIFYIISVVQMVFNGLDYQPTLISKFQDFIVEQSPIVQHILDPLRNMNMSNELLIGYGIISIIVFAIGLLVVKNMKAENSGFMVLNKPLKIISQTLATLTLTSIIFSIVTSLLADYNMYIGIGIYFFFLFASYKLFKALFSIKIKV